MKRLGLISHEMCGMSATRENLPSVGTSVKFNNEYNVGVVVDSKTDLDHRSRSPSR